MEMFFLLQRLRAATPQGQLPTGLEELERGAAPSPPVASPELWKQPGVFRRQLRDLRSWLLPEHLLDFADRLNASQSLCDVSGAVSRAFNRIAGADEVLLLLRVDQEPRHDGRAPARLAACDGRDFSVPSHPSLWRPGTIRLRQPRLANGDTPGELLQLLADTGAVMAAHVPVGKEGIVLLLERRDHRIVEDRDWTLLRGLAAQAEGALRRIRTIEEARELSLTDPLTGLGNRRKMHVIMEHAWAKAKRGEQLSLILLDLNDFKRTNDELGHLAGDRLLGTVADVLRSQVRAADLVVRYGGDEFLILLSGQDLEVTTALIGRVRALLRGTVSFSAGVAEYRKGVGSMEDLLHEADLDLYRAKRKQYDAKR
jgi:diguanylate cyclase (GGDEF)-like protein